MLTHLLKKEIKELLMERSILIGAIIVPLIIFPLMGALTGLGMGAAISKAGAEMAIGLADLDKTNLTQNLLPRMFSEEGLKVTRIECSSDADCLRAINEKGVKFALIIPRGFSRNFTLGLRSEVRTIYSIKSITVSDLTLSERISDAILSAFRALAERVHGKSINPEFFEEPISEKPLVICLNRVVEAPVQAIGSMFLSVLIGLPMVAVIVASHASSVAATSIALEKESKTLEILLTIPARRITILLSKLLGTFVIVLLSTISFLVGFGIYGLMLAGSVVASVPRGADLETSPTFSMNFFSIQGSPLFPPILFSAVFIAMIMMTCIGLLVGILGGDVRSAQQLVGAITFPLLIPPFFVLLFAPIESLPLGVKAALLLDPFTHLFLAIQKGFVGDIAAAGISLGVMIAFTILLLVLSSFLFMGEKLITMRVTVRRVREAA